MTLDKSNKFMPYYIIQWIEKTALFDELSHIKIITFNTNQSGATKKNKLKLGSGVVGVCHIKMQHNIIDIL